MNASRTTPSPKQLAAMRKASGQSREPNAELDGMRLAPDEANDSAANDGDSKPSKRKAKAKQSEPAPSSAAEQVVNEMISSDLSE